jgi:hypothetical protein
MSSSSETPVVHKTELRGELETCDLRHHRTMPDRHETHQKPTRHRETGVGERERERKGGREEGVDGGRGEGREQGGKAGRRGGTEDGRALADNHHSRS